MLRKSLSALVIGVVLAVLAAGYCAMDLYRYAERPADSQAKATQRIVMVKPGVGFRALTDLLAAEGTIRDPFRFRIYARVKGLDKRVKAGEYVLSSGMSPTEVLQTITSGKVRLYRLTIPEGYNLEQIAAAVEKAKLGERPRFLDAVRDENLLKRLQIQADSFEGYLFPETYYFPKGVAADGIIKAMVERFRTVFASEWKARAEALGFSVHEIVTLASIIEKETGAAHERPIISSVFHNRLRRKMRLETDPTVIYGIEDFDGNITREHLATPTPYNTYSRRGLPPGPIASPGAESIEAALYPKETGFLYFVSKGNGTHQFSETIADHNRSVQKYQLRR